MEESQKLRDVILHYARGNQRNFSRATGVDPSTINRILTGKQKLNYAVMRKIGDVYPDALAYLEGRVSIPKTKTVVEELDERDQLIADLKEEIAIKNRVIKALLEKLGE